MDKKVLIVDDDAKLRTLLREYLESYGFQVLTDAETAEKYHFWMETTYVSADHPLHASVPSPPRTWSGARGSSLQSFRATIRRFWPEESHG